MSRSLIHRCRACVAALMAAGAALPAVAQPEPVNGVRAADLRANAIVGATLVPEPGVRIEDASIVMRGGVVVAAGAGIEIPADARIWPGEGMTVYAGLIESALLRPGSEVPETAARHWNPNVRAERRMEESTEVTSELRKELRGLGFTAAAVYPSDAILRGTGAVVCLADVEDHHRVYRAEAGFGIGLATAGWSSRSYPGSLMGAIALVRQTLYDAQWHADCRRVYEREPDGHEPPPPSASLDALAPVIRGDRFVLFDGRDEHYMLRSARIADEFDLDFMLLGCGTEFRRLDEIVATAAPIVLPLDFPTRPGVTTVAEADATSLRALMTWEQAPTNARRLVDAGATIAFTTHRIRRRADFRKNLASAIKHGLTPDAALAALTTVPAELLDLDDVMGTITPGKIANLVVVEGDLFDPKSKIRSTWVNGRRHVVERADVEGTQLVGTLEALGQSVAIELDTKKKKAVFTRPAKDAAEGEASEAKTVRAKTVTVVADQVSILVDGAVMGYTGWLRLSGAVTDDSVVGTGVAPNGARFPFTITRSDVAAAPAVATDDAPDPGPEKLDAPPADPVGAWTLTVAIEAMDTDLAALLNVMRTDEGAIATEVVAMGQTLATRAVVWDEATGVLEFELDGPDGMGAFRATLAGNTLEGTFETNDGAMHAAFTGARGGAAIASGDASGTAVGEVMPPEALPVPFGAYGTYMRPEREDVLFANVTIWTCGPRGIIENGAVLVRDGRIAEIFDRTPKNTDDLGVRIVDGTGKYMTPGLIDCHSHTGIDDGINESRQTNTAEVRIRDSLDPDDVNWYRQLAGGLTAANVLHGSANPIGGQNNVVKLRWGATAPEFPIEGAIEGIKFALGENVKRSENRYPNTRMGVETFIRDAFTAARDYAAAWKRYNALSASARNRTMPPRRDLELDALVEILNGERIIHCHSYRQDEILALIRIADEFGFTIGTFQHVLEGYKVAEAIAAHGAGASSFSDWWAYKVEVMDAIPHNGALMTQVGVVSSFNSDSNEVARRMNTEAAKAARYGGLDPHDALKLVTINVAKQLRVDDSIGSIEVGKDADLALWSAPPLSSYARCEQTWIEGTCLFSLPMDGLRRVWADQERTRLIQRVLTDANGKTPPADEPAVADAAWAWVTDGWRAWAEDQLRRGIDPLEIVPGDCGTGLGSKGNAHGH